MKTHDKMKEEKCTSCKWCLKEFATMYNRKRHESSCMFKTDESNSGYDQAPQNVALAPQNVAHVPQNVAHVPQNVAQAPQNVAQAPQNVAQGEGKESITKLECPLCYKTFTSTWSMHRHVPQCTGTADPNMCCKCRMILPSRYAKSRHMQKCQGHPNSEIACIEDPGHVVSTQQSQAPSAVANVNNVHSEVCNLNQQNNNIQNLNVNIQINSFGKEDLTEVMHPDFLDERLKEFNGKGIFNMLREVHLNPDKPENRNIRLASKKSKTLHVKEDDRWHVRANSDVLELLIGKYKSILTKRSHEPDFKNKLQHESDFMQIQQDLIKFDRKTNPTAYYNCAHKILALIEDLERDTADLE